MKPSTSIPLLLTILSSFSLSVSTYRIFEYPEDQYISPQLDLHRLLNAGNNFTDNVIKFCSHDQECFAFAAYLYTQSELRKEGSRLDLWLCHSQLDIQMVQLLSAEYNTNTCCDGKYIQYICVVFLFLGLKIQVYVILTNSAHVILQLSKAGRREVMPSFLWEIRMKIE